MIDYAVVANAKPAFGGPFEPMVWEAVEFRTQFGDFGLDSLSNIRREFEKDCVKFG